MSIENTMNTVNATVVYPVYISFEVPQNCDEEEIFEKALEVADQMFEKSTIDPIIHDYDVLDKTKGL